MKLTCFYWLDCQHTVTHDESGTRMGGTEIINTSNRPIEQKVATFPCPACSDPDANQDGVGIRPRVQETSTTLTAPAGMQTTPLNPSVGEFHPNTPQHDPFVNTSFSTSGRGHSMPSAAPPTHYISQNMGGTVYFLRAIPSDQEEPQQELIQHQFPSSAGTRYNRRNMNLNQHMAATTRDLHKSGNPCPEGSGWCHWHYARWCHEDPATCHLAQQAISAAFYAHSEWKAAPMGWNAAHESCVRRENPVMCEFHLQLHRRVYGSSYD